MKEFKEYKDEKDRLTEAEEQRELALAELLQGFLDSPVLHVVSPTDDDKTDLPWVVSAGTTGYDQVKLGIQKRMIEARRKNEGLGIPSFADFHDDGEYGIEFLTESENTEVDRWVQVCQDEHDGNPMDEGFLGKLAGGIAGFLLGPTIGKIIAHSLGVQKGILYDMFTSRLVSGVLGAAIAKSFGGGYKA